MGLTNLQHLKMPFISRISVEIPVIAGQERDQIKRTLPALQATLVDAGLDIVVSEKQQRRIDLLVCAVLSSWYAHRFIAGHELHSYVKELTPRNANVSIDIAGIHIMTLPGSRDV